MMVKILRDFRTDFPRKMREGFYAFGTAEGTRSRSGQMIQAQAGFWKAVNVDNSIILVVALEGTEEILPPADQKGLPLPDLSVGLGVFFDLMSVEAVRERAKYLTENYQVDFAQAAMDVIYERIALLHLRYGKRKYMGFYSRSLEEIYSPREELSAQQSTKEG